MLLSVALFHSSFTVRACVLTPVWTKASTPAHRLLPLWLAKCLFRKTTQDWGRVEGLEITGMSHWLLWEDSRVVFPMGMWLRKQYVCSKNISLRWLQLYETDNNNPPKGSGGVHFNSASLPTCRSMLAWVRWKLAVCCSLSQTWLTCFVSLLFKAKYLAIIIIINTILI